MITLGAKLLCIMLFNSRTSLLKILTILPKLVQHCFWAPVQRLRARIGLDDNNEHALALIGAPPLIAPRRVVMLGI